jgi:predicted kinase
VRSLAVETASDLTELHCVCDQTTVERRITLRTSTATDVSDADVAIARAVAARFEPWPVATRIDTTPSPDQVVTAVVAALGVRPRSRLD